MRILAALTYYQPHISGLTIYVQRLAKALVDMGHSVTILTSQYDPALPLDELLDGVRVKRVPVAFRLSKGVVVPIFACTAWASRTQSGRPRKPQGAGASGRKRPEAADGGT